MLDDGVDEDAPGEAHGDDQPDGGGDAGDADVLGGAGQGLPDGGPGAHPARDLERVDKVDHLEDGGDDEQPAQPDARDHGEGDTSSGVVGDVALDKEVDADGDGDDGEDDEVQHRAALA